MLIRVRIMSLWRITTNLLFVKGPERTTSSYPVTTDLRVPTSVRLRLQEVVRSATASIGFVSATTNC